MLAGLDPITEQEEQFFDEVLENEKGLKPSEGDVTRDQ